jgi:hypothetical protein
MEPAPLAQLEAADHLVAIQKLHHKKLQFKDLQLKRYASQKK